MYKCELCKYQTNKKSDFAKHIKTSKHLCAEIGDIDLSANNDNRYVCACGRTYKYDSGYYRHIKKCRQTTISSKMITTDLVMELVQGNKDLKDIILQQHNTINNLVNNHFHFTNNSYSTNISNNVNSMNKTFNLHFFLNETCKNAMNISDFVSNIKMELNDLETTGKIGYVDGISNIILKNLNNLEQNMRPLHCSDLKREILYVKNNNEWTKESEEKPILTKAIISIANENVKQIRRWKEQHPDCIHSYSLQNDQYLNILNNSMPGSSPEECERNYNKIINNVAKETTIGHKCRST